MSQLKYWKKRKYLCSHTLVLVIVDAKQAQAVAVGFSVPTCITSREKRERCPTPFYCHFTHENPARGCDLVKNMPQHGRTQLVSWIQIQVDECETRWTQWKREGGGALLNLPEMSKGYVKRRRCPPRRRRPGSLQSQSTLHFLVPVLCCCCCFSPVG